MNSNDYISNCLDYIPYFGVQNYVNEFDFECKEYLFKLIFDLNQVIEDSIRLFPPHNQREK